MKKRKCKKGYSCGKSCISVKRVCRKKLTGQSVDIADSLSEMISSTTKLAPDADLPMERPISSEGFDKKLGEGFFGSVYSNGKGQALKTIPTSELLDELAESYHVKNSVDAQNLIAEAGFAPKVLGYETAGDGTSKILMEELEGFVPLKDYIGKGSKVLSRELKESLDDKLYEASKLFLSHRMTHNDINAGNVMINDKGDIQIIDYDFAKFFPEDEAQTAKVMNGVDFDKIEKEMRKLNYEK